MKKFEKKSAGPLERLRLRSGIYASAVTVLVVVLAVLLNLIVRTVPTKYTEFDLSEAGLYTLSGSSKDIAHALTQDVTIYYLAETGSEDAIITKLLDRYASESSHIKWETKDPAVYPTFAAQYGVQSAENGQRGRHHHKAAGPLRLREQPHQVGDERPRRLPDLRRPVRRAVG